MADYRDRNRGSSIFSDDERSDRWRDERGQSDRWRGGSNRDGWRSEDHGWGGDPSRSRDWQDRHHAAGGRAHDDRHRSSDDRGFFERAGDEIRSWFGDDEAERRREQDARRHEHEQGMSGGRYRGGHEDQWTGRRMDRSGDRWSGGSYERSQMRPNGGWSGGYGQDDSGRGGYGGARQTGQGYGQQQAQSWGGGQMGGIGHSSMSGAPHDESYRRWRDQQIAQLDREYDEYRQHRQQQFEQDFTSFRQNRQSGITSGGPTMGESGQAGSFTASQPTAGAQNATDVHATAESGFAEAGTSGKSKRG